MIYLDFSSFCLKSEIFLQPRFHFILLLIIEKQIKQVKSGLEKRDV
ncbi:hypothetical protein X474_22800 [Dethiosulfatarculus sandiegensis]|uniref:Uncharacterized protein n=1 Tax=Dethiosulfatarculus sandiegensis TaxID=1429043 RepID=A0A0D2J7Q9_9BACT|nr:hypothetical protein X474_22800 [Dethiosulfatarculus sandiegensis]